jgi:hypothetical protein
MQGPLGGEGGIGGERGYFLGGNGAGKIPAGKFGRDGILRAMA